MSDGCTAQLSCGTCSGALSCGGGGTANVCGGTCLAGCPPGYACDSLGVCSGASASLTLNVVAVPVSGAVRLNGAVPATGSSCAGSPTSTTGYVSFTDAATGSVLSADTVCGATNFDFALTVPPGTYQVTVYGYGPRWSNLPQGRATVNPALAISGPTSGLTLNVPAVPVSGAVRLNGAVPATGSSCAGSPTSTTGYVSFTDLATGAVLSADTVCGATNFDFALTAPPGTYRVTVYGYGPRWSNLPQGSAAAVSQLRLQ